MAPGGSRADPVMARPPREEVSKDVGDYFEIIAWLLGQAMCLSEYERRSGLVYGRIECCQRVIRDFLTVP